MIIPPTPHSDLGKADKEGNVKLHPEWRNYFDNLNRTLLTNAGTTAIVSPSLSSNPINDQFARLTAAAVQPLNGSIVYDSFTNELKTWVNGAYKVIQVV